MDNLRSATNDRVESLKMPPYPWMPPIVPPPPGPIVPPCRPHEGGKDKPSGLAQYASAKDFPDIGNDKVLYVDLSTQKLYYWKENGYFSVDADCDCECDFDIDGSILYGGNAYDEER